MRLLPKKGSANRILAGFARWFGSSGGVWQTCILLLFLVLLEFGHVIHDPQGFWVLYWCTVYSAVTQPVLAYANKQDTAQGNEIQAELQALLAKINDSVISIEEKEDEELIRLQSVMTRIVNEVREQVEESVSDLEE